MRFVNYKGNKIRVSIRGDDLRRRHGLAERVPSRRAERTLSASKHIIKGAVRVYVAELYYNRTLPRYMSKCVEKTCGICTTSIRGITRFRTVFPTQEEIIYAPQQYSMDDSPSRWQRPNSFPKAVYKAYPRQGLPNHTASAQRRRSKRPASSSPHRSLQ